MRLNSCQGNEKIQIGKQWKCKEKWKKWPFFFNPNHPASVIVLVVNIASTTLVRPLSWRRQTTVPVMLWLALESRDWTEGDSPAVCAGSSPAVDSGSGCGAEGKPRLPGLQTQQGCRLFWCREMRICLCRSLHHPRCSPTSSMGVGQKFRRAGPLGLRQRRPPAHALFSLCCFL